MTSVGSMLRSAAKESVEKAEAKVAEGTRQKKKIGFDHMATGVQRNKAWSKMILLGGFCAVAGAIVLQRAGLTSPYGRVKHLVSDPQWQTQLLPGSTPSNVHLPPHLRLDARSYLDNPETEIALPPLIDPSVSPVTQLQGMAESTGTTVSTRIGPFGEKLIIFDAVSQQLSSRGYGPAAASKMRQLAAEHLSHKEKPTFWNVWKYNYFTAHW
jgi:hypothetical protein